MEVYGHAEEIRGKRAARHRQEKRKATRLGISLLSHTEAISLRSDTHWSIIVDESKKSLYGRETDRDLRSA